MQIRAVVTDVDGTIAHADGSVSAATLRAGRELTAAGIPMFRLAGQAVAMGNAHPDALAAANTVTESVTDDGFSRELQRLGLISPPATDASETAQGRLSLVRFAGRRASRSYEVGAWGTLGSGKSWAEVSPW